MGFIVSKTSAKPKSRETARNHRRPHPMPTFEAAIQRGPVASIADGLEFSRRELEIVRLVFQDAADCAIADELGISVNTVHTHLKRVYEAGRQAGRGWSCRSSTKSWLNRGMSSTLSQPCCCSPVPAAPPDTGPNSSFFSYPLCPPLPRGTRAAAQPTIIRVSPVGDDPVDQF